MIGKNQWNCQVDKPTAEKYKEYFREHGIYFEPSSAYDMVYILFYVNDEELQAFENWIEGAVMNA